MAGQGRILAVLGGVLAVGVAAALFLVAGGGGESSSENAEKKSAATTADVDAKPQAKRAAKRAGSASITGEIRRTKGKAPVADQEVQLLPEKGDPWTVKTDAHGAFALTEIPHGVALELRVAASGCGTIRVPGIVLERNEKRSVGTLWLDPAVRLPVQVRTWDGKPVEGALVEAFATPLPDMNDPRRFYEAAFREPTAVAKVTTDAKGDAVFPELVTGRFAFVATKSGFGRAARAGVSLRSDTTPPTLKMWLGAAYGLTGRVVDTSKNPVPGAAVFAGPANFGDLSSSAPMRVRTTTDASGRFEFKALEAGDTSLWAATKDMSVPLQIATVRIPDVKQVDLFLKGVATVTGTVTEKDGGKPIEGATVRTFPFGASGSVQTTTDAQGRYALVVTAGVVGMTNVEKDGWAQTDEATMFRQQTLREGESTVRDLKMRPGAKVTGVVKGPDGPIAGAKIVVAFTLSYGGQSQKTATADGDGRYEVGGLGPCKAVVRADAPGFYLKDFPETGYWQLLQQPGASPFKFDVAEGASVTRDLEMTRGQTVDGRVDCGDAPLEGVRVTTFADQEGGVVTGADGTFHLEGVKPVTAAVLMLVKDGYTPLPSNKPFPVTAEQPASGVVLKMTPVVTIRGTATATDGAPLVDGKVMIVSAGGQEGSMRMSSSRFFASQTSAPILPDGSFEVQAPSQVGSQVRVSASATGRAAATSDPIAIVEGRSEYTADVKLDVGRDVEGRVTSKQGGAPVPGAMIYPWKQNQGPQMSQQSFGPGGQSAWAVTDADGRFTVSHLSPATYGFQARADGFVAASTTIDVSSVSQADIQIEPELAIEGTVTFADGTGAEGASVSAAKDDGSGNARPTDNFSPGRGFSTTTGPGGKFRIAGLSAGAWRLSVSASWPVDLNLKSRRTDPILAGTTDAHVVVEAGGVIAGRVLDPQKKPLANAWVYANVEGDAGKGGGDYHGSRTKDDGTYAIVGLLDGATYSVNVQTNTGGWDGGAGGFKNAQLTNVAPGAKNADFNLEEGLGVSGVIVTADDKPVANAFVYCSWTSADGKNRQSRNANTDATGAFSFGGLDPGECVIALMGGGPSQGLMLENADKIPAGTKNLKLVASRGMSITGCAVDENGVAVKGFYVQVVPKNGSGPNNMRFNRGATVKDDGTFEASGLAPGTYTLTAGSGDRVPMKVEDVAAGSTNVKFVLVHGLEASGRVLDESGAPIRNAQLMASLSTDGSKTSYAQSDSEGRFTLKGLVDGTYDVRVFDMGNGSGGYKKCGAVTAGATGVDLHRTP